MSLLQMFPNCSSVLHLNAFVFLFLSVPFQRHILSVWLSHSALSACAALPLSFNHSRVFFSPDFCQSVRVVLPVSRHSTVGSLWLLHKAWRGFQLSQRTVSQWWACAYLLSHLSIFSSPLSSSSSSSSSVTIVAVLTIITIGAIIAIVITFIIFCCVWLL